MVTRRSFLALSSISATAFAGCSSQGSSEDDTQGSSEDDITPKTTPTDDSTDGSGDGSADSTTLDIREFGAEVDGNTDDTHAIQRALSAADPGDSVFFPSGTTVVSAEDGGEYPAIRLAGDDLAEDLTLHGTGKDSIIQMAGGHTSHHRLLYFDVKSGYKGLVIRDLRIDGNREEQPTDPGIGGHGIFSNNADSADVPVDVLIENVWVEDCNQSGISPKHGGFVINRCTVRNCAQHGISPDSWTDVHKYDPPIEVRNCYVTQNGYGGGPTYGIDISGGKVLVENCVVENNVQGTKTTEQVIEATYRRVRLKGNDINGYLRPGPTAETDERATVTFEDVISEENGAYGFRLGADTDFTVPEGKKIIATRNSSNGGDDNIYITQNATLTADTVWSTYAVSGYGIYVNSTKKSRISNYHYFNNRRGSIRNSPNIEISNTVDMSDLFEHSGRGDTQLIIDIETVPTKGDVGARSDYVITSPS